MCRSSLRGVGWGEKEIQQEEVLLITYNVDTGQSSGIYKVCPPLGIAINRQGTSIGCQQVFKNHVKGEGKYALHFRPIKGTLANGGLLTDHPGEMQTQKY